MTDSDSRCPTCGQELDGGVAAYVEALRAAPARIGSPRWWRERTGYETGCFICGGELLANSGTYYKRWAPHRWFCSNACRQRAYRIRKKVAAAEELEG